MTSSLEKIKACLNPKWVLSGIESENLKEDDLHQIVKIKADGIPYLLFELDRKKEDPFPFFSDHSGMKLRTDYLLFTESKGSIFVFSIELKSGGEKKARPQILATKEFSIFLFERIQFVQNIGLKPKYFGIACIPNAKANISSKVFNEKKIAVNGGKELYLKRYVL